VSIEISQINKSWISNSHTRCVAAYRTDVRRLVNRRSWGRCVINRSVSCSYWRLVLTWGWCPWGVSVCLSTLWVCTVQLSSTCYWDSVNSSLSLSLHQSRVLWRWINTRLPKTQAAHQCLSKDIVYFTRFKVYWVL